jgi:NYN domain
VDRCAVLVDAGYVLADGAMAVHGTRHRDSVSWDYAGLVKLLTGLSRDRTGLPVLRCYWYEATVEGRRSSEHNALADLPGVKLRLGRVRPGRREGVEAEMHRDLTTLARNRAVSDVVIVSAEEDLTEVVAEVQEFGLRVLIVHITADGNWTVSRPLRQECDDIVEISSAHLRPFVDLIPGAEPSGRDDQYRNGSYPARGHERRGIANGHGGGLGAVTHQGLPAAALPAPPAIYTAPVVEEYQRTAQPPAQGQGPLASSGLAGAASEPPSPGSHAAPRRPAAASQPAPDQDAPPNRAVAARDAADAQDPAGARAQTAPQVPPPPPQPQGAHQAQAAHQAPGAHQAQDAGQFPAAAQGPASPGPPAQPAAAPGPPVGYGAQPGNHAGDHVPAHGNPGRRGSPGPQSPPPQAVLPVPVPQTSVPPAPAQPSPVQQTPVQPTTMPQDPVPQDPVPQASVPPPPARQAPVPQTPVPQTPVPQTPVPPAPVQQSPVPPAPVPQAPMPQPGMHQSAAPQPGPGEARFGAGQGDYRAPEPPAQRAGPAREAMPARDREATLSAGPAGQFAENTLPGRFTGDPVQARFADGALPGRFAEDQAPGRFAEGPVPYPSAPPGAYGAGSPAQPSYPQFPGQPGQHAAPGPESGYPERPASVAPQHEPGLYGGPPAGHANLPRPVSPPTTISLTDAVQAAHAEGFGFGDEVARDAPALWLEAVLARKPRMPSDLEARLLQGSALPIDSLLHDEVRQSLRRGFWEALERSRR